MSVEGRPTISTRERVNLLTLLGLTLSGFRNYKLLFGQTTMGRIHAFCRKTDYVANTRFLALVFTQILREFVKNQNGVFTVRLTVRGGGHPQPDHKHLGIKKNFGAKICFRSYTIII